MDCFIKKIFQGSIDEQVHNKFVRFGKGSYKGRALVSLHKTSKVKLKGGFEYANDFVLLVAELQDVKFSGIILSKEKLNLEGEKKKAGLFSYEVELGSEQVKELENKVYYFLLDAETPEIKLKIKKKLPKPGKGGEGKGDEKFCQLEADLKYYPAIREAFFWDADGKKVKAEHVYEIKELIIPKGEDFEKIRLGTKRRGMIKRKLETDGREQIKEKEFEV